MKSEARDSEQKSAKEETQNSPKKVVVPPKSPKPSTSERSHSLIKKLHLKSKFTPSSAPIERQTPEGGDHFVLTKSASETNLKKSWKSAENSPKDNKRSSTESAVTGECDQFYLISEQKGRPGRTKSLENLKNMPAFGELMMSETHAMSNASQSTSRPKDHLYKILVIGDLGTGKTSIIKRYVHRFFTQHYRATIGVDFALKVLNWDDNTLIRLQLWDIAGQERYGNMTRVYYKEAVGAFIVFDVTRKNTFESVTNWKTDLDSKVQLADGSSIPCVLLANKCDQLKDNPLNNSHMEDYCQKNGFTAWFETSARDNINIDEAARALVEKILEQDALLTSEARMAADQFSLTLNSNDSRNARKCSC